MPEFLKWFVYNNWHLLSITFGTHKNVQLLQSVFEGIRSSWLLTKYPWVKQEWEILGYVKITYTCLSFWQDEFHFPTPSLICFSLLLSCPLFHIVFWHIFVIMGFRDVTSSLIGISVRSCHGSCSSSCFTGFFVSFNGYMGNIFLHFYHVHIINEVKILLVVLRYFLYLV